MLFTDGGEDRAQDVFMQYNWPNKTVGFAHRTIFFQSISGFQKHSNHFVLFSQRCEFLLFPWVNTIMMSHLYSGSRAPTKVS